MKLLKNSFLNQIGVNDVNVSSISEELNDVYTDCLIVTQPHSFDAN